MIREKPTADYMQISFSSYSNKKKNKLVTIICLLLQPWQKKKSQEKLTPIIHHFHQIALHLFYKIQNPQK